MKTYLSLFILSFFLLSCFTKKKINPDLLPKDISQMQFNRTSEGDFLETEAKNLQILNQNIKNIATSIPCTSVEDWRITPLGSKPCGGPKEYIAYHKNVEAELVPMIQDYTRREAHYNIMAKLTSDCLLAAQPSGIICQNGKPVLVEKKEIPTQ